MTVPVRDLTDFRQCICGEIPSNYPQTEGEPVLVDLPHEPSFFEGPVINRRHIVPPYRITSLRTVALEAFA